MREFKLWNQSKTASFDFKSEGIVITEVSGLGIGYSATISNGIVVNYEKEFEQISLLANFGINSNAYTAFNNLANFIATNGKKHLVLEYSVNDRTLYADVWLTRLPKSQKTNFNILSEKLVFTRTTHWYSLENGTLSETLIINNQTTDDILVNLVITGPTDSNFSILLADDSNTLSTIKLNNFLSNSSQILYIDAENKTVIMNNNGTIQNKYNLINKAYDTFIIVPPGQHHLSYTGIAGMVEYEFKKWVID